MTDAVSFALRHELRRRVDHAFGVNLDPGAWVEFIARQSAAPHGCRCEDVLDYVSRRLPADHRALRIVSHRRVFRELRAHLCALCDVPQAAVRPSTPLAPLFPPSERGRRWRELRNRAGTSLPELKDHAGHTAVVAVAWAVATIGFVLLLIELGGSGRDIGLLSARPPTRADWNRSLGSAAWSALRLAAHLLYICAAGFVPWLLLPGVYRLVRGVERRLPPRLPDDCATVRDLVRCLARAESGRPEGGALPLNPHTAWLAMRQCVALYLNIDERRVRRSHCVIRDLGVPPPECRGCQYVLTANVSGVCPECGTPIRQAAAGPPTQPAGRGRVRCRPRVLNRAHH